MKAIAAELAVSLSSVSLWTRDIVLTDEQRRVNLRRAGVRRSRVWSERHRRQRASHQEEGREYARLGDPLHRAGCMLYWAEGGKGRNQVCFSNSDVEMVRCVRWFLTTCLDVRDDAFAVSLNVYTNNGLSICDIETRWLDALELPRTCLRKHMINHFPTSSSGRARGRLPYGVCSLKVHSTRVVQHIYGAIQEYAGIDRPGWLD